MKGILMYASWVAGPVLQITLLLFMFRRKWHGVFPRFFSYIIFQIVKSGILFVVYRYSPDNYFDAYWAGNAISVLLGVAVMDEILQHLLKQWVMRSSKHLATAKARSKLGKMSGARMFLCCNRRQLPETTI